MVCLKDGFDWDDAFLVKAHECAHVVKILLNYPEKLYKTQLMKSIIYAFYDEKNVFWEKMKIKNPDNDYEGFCSSVDELSFIDVKLILKKLKKIKNFTQTFSTSSCCKYEGIMIGSIEYLH